MKSVHKAFSVQVMDCACVPAASLRICSTDHKHTLSDDGRMQMDTLAV